MASSFNPGFSSRVHPNDVLTVHLSGENNLDDTFNKRFRPARVQTEPLQSIYLHVDSSTQTNKLNNYNFTVSVRPQYMVKSLRMLEATLPILPNITSKNCNGAVRGVLYLASAATVPVEVVANFNIPLGWYDPTTFATTLADTLQKAFVRAASALGSTQVLGLECAPTVTYLSIKKCFVVQDLRTPDKKGVFFTLQDRPNDSYLGDGGFLLRGKNFAQFPYITESGGFMHAKPTITLFNTSETIYSKVAGMLYTRYLFVNSTALNRFSTADSLVSDVDVDGDIVGIIPLAVNPYNDINTLPSIQTIDMENKSILINMANPSKMIDVDIDIYLLDEYGSRMEELVSVNDGSVYEYDSFVNFSSVSFLFRLDVLFA